MAERSASVTMPQNKPNDEKPASPASIVTTSDGEDVDIQVSLPPTTDQVSNGKKQETATVEGEAKPAKTNDDSVKQEGVKVTKAQEVVANNKDSKVEPVQDVASKEGTPIPVKDGAAIETPPRFKYSQEEETKAQGFISRAHAATHGTATAIFTDDQDIKKLTEMVSQLTHLLAACGSVSTSTLHS